MKKLFCFCSLIALSLLMTGCFSVEQPGEVKTEYSLNEIANIDFYEITLNDVVTTTHYQDVPPANDTYLMFEFRITNDDEQAHVLSSATNFRFIIDDMTYTDLNHNKDITIQPGESIMYQVIYDVPEEDHYQILFYSGVVSNNIAFTTK